MSTEVIVYVLTALAAVVIVLTRLRLGSGDRGAGRLHMGHGLVHVHTVAGEDSAAGSEIVGIVALALWWVVVVAGLLILVRWLPSRGRHASEGQEDSWSEGPGLSILAHLGMLVGVGVFTWAYLTAAV